MNDDKPKPPKFAPVKPLFIEADQIVHVVRLSQPTIDGLEHQGEFPRRRKLSGRRVGYLLREVEEWAESRPVSDLLPVAVRKVAV